MSQLADRYERGALEAWTHPQQAALYRIQKEKQREADLEEEYVKDKTTERVKEGFAKGKKRQDWKREATRVNAGKLVDDLYHSSLPEAYDLVLHINSWNPPIYQVLDLIGPPHLILLPFIAIHFAYWLMAPWYIRFITFYPLIYVVPGWCAIVSVLKDRDRLLWLCYFLELATMDYVEFVLYKDRLRSLTFWPQCKAILCFVLYTAVKFEHDQPVYGAVELLRLVIPKPNSTSSSNSGGSSSRNSGESRSSGSSAKSK